MVRRATCLALGTALVAAAATFAPAAHASRIGFDVSIGGPGYGVSFGNAPFFHHRHFYRTWVPAYVPPPVVYSPPVVYAPPVRFVYRAPYFRHRVFARGPVYYHRY